MLRRNGHNSGSDQATSLDVKYENHIQDAYDR